MDSVLKAIGAAVMFSAGIILLVPLSVLFGWITGLILKIFCGTLIANGLNLLFNTNRFSPNQLPIVCATLAAFSGYLRTTVTTKKDK